MSDDLQRELAVVRQQIDRVDGQLLELLNERARHAQEVGRIKARYGEAGFGYRITPGLAVEGGGLWQD